MLISVAVGYILFFIYKKIVSVWHLNVLVFFSFLAFIKEKLQFCKKKQQSIDFILCCFFEKDNDYIKLLINKCQL